VSVSGATNNAASHAVATHQDQSSAGATDAIVVAGGLSPSLEALHFTTDNNGVQYVNAPGSVPILTSAARTTTQTGADQITPGGYRGLVVYVSMTAVGTGSITMTIQGKDPTSAVYYTILAGAAVITNVFNVYRVYPTITAVSNAIAQDALPAVWRILVTANNANSATYSVGASYLV